MDKRGKRREGGGKGPGKRKTSSVGIQGYFAEEASLSPAKENSRQQKIDRAIANK